MKKLLPKRRQGVNRFAHRCYVAALVIALLAMSNLCLTAQSLDNKGTDFIMAFNPNISTPTGIELHLTSEVATMVTVNYPVNAPTFATTVAVNPGVVTVVVLPNTASQGWNPNNTQNNCVRAFATSEFVCYLINRASATSDAALALPIDTMNTFYIVVDYQPTFLGSQFTVVAAFDNTTVTITPKTAMVGRPAGVPFNVVLNRGQGYHARGATTSAANFLAGTTIESDRPIGMVNGNGCHQVPTGTQACDHTFEVAQPVASWGREVLVANLPNRPNGSLYRIVASEDNTTVNLDGAFLTMLNKGGVFTQNPLAGNHRFSADKPIFVAQYMTGQGSPGAVLGDPAMGNMIPSEQYLNSYTFSTVGGGQFVQNFVTVIARNADIGAVLLDGVAIPAINYTAIPGGTHSAAIMPLASGTHRTTSPNPHGITVEGYNSFDSYLYPGGALFQFINPVGDANAPNCTSQQLPGPPPSVCGTATDNRPSEDTNGNDVLDPGEDLNGNGQIDRDTGIFFVQLAPGAVNLTLTVDPFTPGDGTATYCVRLTDPNQSGSGAVVATDGAGNQCRTEINLVVGSVNAPPTVGSTCQPGNFLGQLVRLSASDDATPVPSIKIWVLDSGTRGFKAGPFKSGDVLVVGAPTPSPFAKPLGGQFAAYVRLRGGLLLMAEDGAGATSPNTLPCQP